MSGSAAGYFRIWKVPEAEEKARTPKAGGGRALAEDPSSRRGTAQALCPPHGGQEGEQGRSRADSRKVRSRAKDLVSSRTKEEGSAKKEDVRPRSQMQEAKLQGPEEEAGPREACETDRPEANFLKTDRIPHGQAKTQ